MILGFTLLIAALVSTVLANVLFTAARRPKAAPGLFGAAKGAVLGGAAGIVGAAAYLAYLIATHQFQFAYVAEYSSLRSNQWYLLAAFWGGQEGSILLWAFWTAVLGIVLAFRAGDKERTSRVWPIFGLVQVFLLGLLLVKCPFVLGKGAVPHDGRGLNPLLENMWMVIHPPILFLGFASLAVPFVWTLYGLIYRDWDGWAKAAFSWVLFAFATLGFGLSLGGYWAYETLGWGGFWGWDPVENSSLVPWLFVTALLHGISLQHKNGGYKVTNLALGFLPFAFMVYGTFLTRTGLLSDFSMHSFSSLGRDGYYVLLGGLALSVLVPTGFIVARFKQIPKPAAYEKVLTREFGYFFATALLGLMGVIVAVGMSAPLITKLWTAKGAMAQPSFYNQANYPLAILLSLAMAVTPYLAWKANSGENLRRKLILPYAFAIALSMLMAGVAVGMGVRQPLMLLLFATSVFAVLANIQLALPRLKNRTPRRTVGGFLAHAGAGLLIAGVACLVAFSQTAQRVPLYKGFPVEVMGYKLTYLGMTSHSYDRDSNALRVKVEKDGKVWEARPRYYLAPWNNQDTVFANPPAVLPSVYTVDAARPATWARMLPWNNPFHFGDLYIALAAAGPETMNDGQEGRPLNPNAGFVMHDQETKQVGDYSFTFLGLDLDDEARAALATHDPKKMNSLPNVTFTASIGVEWRGRQEIVTPKIRLEQGTGGVYSTPTRIPGPDGSTVMLNWLPPGKNAWNSENPFRIMLFQTINAEDPTEHVYLDVSTKPMIGLVWAGSLLYTLGGLIAYRRRAREAGLIGGRASDDND
jgi:cytochrome c-type biogenesis protein CcmF